MSQNVSPWTVSISGIVKAWPWLPYVAPFGVFAVLTTLLPMTPLGAETAYFFKTSVAGVMVVIFWPLLRREIQWTFDGLAVAAGVGVFLIWIALEGLYPQIGHSSFDPYTVAGQTSVTVVIGIRLFGAVMVVPLVEEIFWRAFVMRFLVASRFKSVPLGQFTWYSFIITAIAFGFEHHRWLPGIAAGIIYAALLHRTRNLFSPILAHAITNLLLGLYVVYTGQWTYW